MKSTITLKISGSPADIERIKRIIRQVDNKQLKQVARRLELEYSFDEKFYRDDLPEGKKISEATKIINLLESCHRGGQPTN